MWVKQTQVDTQSCLPRSVLLSAIWIWGKALATRITLRVDAPVSRRASSTLGWRMNGLRAVPGSKVISERVTHFLRNVHEIIFFFHVSKAVLGYVI